MAMRFMEGFDKYTAAADLALRATLVGTVGYNSSGGRFGGGCVTCGNANSYYYDASFPAIDASIGRIHLAFWAKISALPTSAQTIAQLRSTSDSSNGIQIEVNTLGSLNLYAYGDTGPAWRGPGFMADLGYHHIEIEMLVANSGYARLWFDGVLMFDKSFDTSVYGAGYTAIDHIRLKGLVGVTTTSFDDVVVWDETGADFTTRQIKEHRIETIDPTSDSAVQFTPSTGGSNYALIDESGFHNADTDYVESTTIGHTDLYGMGSLASSPTAIHCLGVNVRAKKTDVGATNMHVHLKSSSTEVESGDHSLTSGYLQYSDYWGKDPATSAAWASAAAVNAALIGMEYQA